MRNTNPTCSSFISSCKSLLVNNFVSLYSVGANCKTDESTGPLDNLKLFLVNSMQVYAIEPYIDNNLNFPQSEISATETVVNFASNYVAGYAGKKILSKHPFKFCKQIMCSSDTKYVGKPPNF